MTPLGSPAVIANPVLRCHAMIINIIIALLLITAIPLGIAAILRKIQG
jgi:hypothetical protein